MVRPIVAREVTVADMTEFARLLPATHEITCDREAETFRVGLVDEDGDVVPLEEQ